MRKQDKKSREAPLSCGAFYLCSFPMESDLSSIQAFQVSPQLS